MYICIYIYIYRDADKSLAQPGRKQDTATEDFEFHIYPIYNHNWGNICTIYITRLASKEIFSPSNKIHREVGRVTNLSAPLCIYIYIYLYIYKVKI